MQHITEIVPELDTMPDWAKEAFLDGQFFTIALARVEQLQEKLADKDCTCKHCEYHAGGFGYPPLKRRRKQ